MNNRILFTFLNLGNTTSHNLDFAYRKDVFVSYGEETITESNLLEIRRQHQKEVRVHTISKRDEALVGADWEWPSQVKFIHCV